MNKKFFLKPKRQLVSRQYELVRQERLLPVPDMGIFPMAVLRGLCPFPGNRITFFASRTPSVNALREAFEQKSWVVLAWQREASYRWPNAEEIAPVGVLARVRSYNWEEERKLASVQVTTADRVALVEFKDPEGSRDAARVQIIRLTDLPMEAKELLEAKAIRRQLLEHYHPLTSVEDEGAKSFFRRLMNTQEVGLFADRAAMELAREPERKEKLLCERSPIARMRELLLALTEENRIGEYQRELMAKIKEAIDKDQRDYYLREQMKVIQKELGEGENQEEEMQGFLEKLEKTPIPERYKKTLEKEIRKLTKYPFGFPEGAVLRNYLDLVFSLPWDAHTEENLDIAAVRKRLDADHYGLQKVKERILEFLAVRGLQQRSGDTDYKSPILCLVGPPGVGKTSIAQSIAEAINRRFVRMSLGGVRDEAEIRGHRRTYIGAMPGRFITAIQQAESKNPLLLLDEIDKLGNDYRGDPASALLEILDPAQNKHFRDHFLEIPFDCSQVLFLTTANTTETIPFPLLDRMEIIELGGYTRLEKLAIAQRHILPKVMKENTLTKKEFQVSGGAILRIIDEYTREAGVRLLEQKLAKLCRKAAVQLLEEERSSVHVTATNLPSFLGQPLYQKHGLEKQAEIGLVTGLAWTSVGGEILQVEVGQMPGKGSIQLTGRLGEVMKESAQVALAYVRSVAERYGIDPAFYQNKDLHIHVPEGAVPKDGPSAGITLATGIISALTRRPVRNDIAMTGELTIRGRILAIGGVKEKMLAAHRAGVKEVFLPKSNRPQWEEVPEEVRKDIKVHWVEQAEEVWEQVLLPARAEEETSAAK